jgi:hypothetical protein
LVTRRKSLAEITAVRASHLDNAEHNPAAVTG